jgi:hypothetical protein
MSRTFKKAVDRDFHSTNCLNAREIRIILPLGTTSINRDTITADAEGHQVFANYEQPRWNPRQSRVTYYDHRHCDGSLSDDDHHGERRMIEMSTSAGSISGFSISFRHSNSYFVNLNLLAAKRGSRYHR